MSANATALERLGGPSILRDIVEDFVGRLYDDRMIGYMFSGVDRLTLAQREFEFTARFLGADIEYSGRPIRKAHAKHRVMGGQFDRRTTILRETLADHAVPADVQREWLAHVEQLRGSVTRQSSGECD